MRRSSYAPLLLFVPLLAACEDGTGPEPRPGPVETGVDVSLDAELEQTDSSLVVNGEKMFDFPNIDRAIRIERYHHFDFGGTTLPSSVRVSDSWHVALLHQRSEVTRNDSTIWSYVDHGDVEFAGVPVEKTTDAPHVMPGDPLGFENFVMYRQTTHRDTYWLSGQQTSEPGTSYHDDLVDGEAIEITTTGSPGVPATSGSFNAASMATLVAAENGDALDLAATEPPILDAAQPLVLEFDHPLDPARAWIHVYPMWPAPSGARRAFMQPQSAAERIVIPASVLASLVQDATEATVAYVIVIEEYWTDPGALTGTVDGVPFSVPLFQEGETSLDVYIAR